MNSGLAVAVVHDGQPLLVRGFGSARLKQEDSDQVDRPVPVTENTKFAIASLSKAFTATLIGILLKEQEKRSVTMFSTSFVLVAVGNKLRVNTQCRI